MVRSSCFSNARPALAIGPLAAIFGCNPNIQIDLSGLEPLAVTAPAELAPRGTGLADVKGGTPPYSFSFAGDRAQTGADAMLDDNHGIFRLGSLGRVTEGITVTDAKGETRTSTIEVTSAIAIDPSRAVIDPAGIADFDAVGGQPPYSFRVEGLSEDRVDPGTGIFEAGLRGGRSTSVVVTDSNGAEARAEVQVTLTFSAGSNGHELAVLDLTRDGELDLVVAGFGSGDLVIMEGDGSGNFTRLLELPLLTFPRAMVVRDLNRDGLQDLILTGFSPNVLVAMLQDPTAVGSLREVVRQPVASNPLDLDVLPLPGDRFSVVTVSEGGKAFDRMELEVSGMSALVRTSTRVALPDRGTRMVTGDFLGDGSPDLVVGVRRGAADPSLILFYQGDAEGRFSRTPNVTLAAGLGTVALAVGNLGGGPKDDVAATFSTSSELALIMDDPQTGLPAIDRHVIPAGDGSQCAACGRAEDSACAPGASCVLTKEGLLQTVCAFSCESARDCYNGTDCQDLPNVGRLCMPRLNVCPTTELIPTGANPRAAKIADLDLDGVNEILLTVVTENSLELYRRGPDGRYSRASVAATGNNPWELALIDVTGDGFLDVITANRIGNNITVLPGLGRLFTKTGDFAFGDSPSTTVVADFDRGEPKANDVLLKLDGAYLTLLGDGRGGLRPYRRLEFTSPQIPLVMDFDRDGYLDFFDFHGLARTIEFVPWEAGVGFSGGPETSTGMQPLGMGLADVDRDGKLDALVANNLDLNFTLHLGHGDGSFSPYALDHVVHRYAESDILPRSVLTSTDARGNLEYFVAMSIKANNITYLDSVELDTARQPTILWSSIIPGNAANLTGLECNGDDKLDFLLTFTSVENNAYDLKVFASGLFVSEAGARQAFSLAADLHTGDADPLLPGVYSPTGPAAVALADFDNDGIQDLAVTTNLQKRIFLFRGNGDCTFAKVASVATEGAVTGLSAGDLDSDGLPDLTGTVQPGRFVVYKNLGARTAEVLDFPKAKSFCAECTADSECGTELDDCADRLGRRTICSRDCSGGKACPLGFACQDAGSGRFQCLHEGDECVY